MSLAASALKEKQTRSDEIVFELEGTNLSLLKSAVIYGANASGKSNLVKALDFFKWFVINSSKGVQSGESIRVESFRLNRRTEQEPSYFEAVFADETVQYRYGFEVDEKRVHREWLYQKGNKRKSILPYQSFIIPQSKDCSYIAKTSYLSDTQRSTCSTLHSI